MPSSEISKISEWHAVNIAQMMAATYAGAVLLISLPVAWLMWRFMKK